MRLRNRGALKLETKQNSTTVERNEILELFHNSPRKNHNNSCPNNPSFPAQLRKFCYILRCRNHASLTSEHRVPCRNAKPSLRSPLSLIFRSNWIVHSILHFKSIVLNGLPGACTFCSARGSVGVLLSSVIRQ